MKDQDGFFCVRGLLTWTVFVSFIYLSLPTCIFVRATRNSFFIFVLLSATHLQECFVVCPLLHRPLFLSLHTLTCLSLDGHSALVCACVSFVTAALRKTGFWGLILLRIRFLLVCASLLGFNGGTLRGADAHVHPLSPSLSLSLSPSALTYPLCTVAAAAKNLLYPPKPRTCFVLFFIVFVVFLSMKN